VAATTCGSSRAADADPRSLTTPTGTIRSPVASGYEHSLRPSLGTSIAPATSDVPPIPP
jgi:hypothetical protein